MKNRLLLIIVLLAFIINNGYNVTAAHNHKTDVKEKLQLKQKIYNSNYKWGNQTLIFNNIIAVQNGYLVTGRQRSNQGIVIKLNQDLERDWDIKLSSPILDIIQLGKDEIVLLTKHQVLMINHQGQEKWRQKYNHVLEKIEQISDDQFIIAGAKEGQPCLAQVSTSGKQKWRRIYASQKAKKINALVKTKMGHLIVAGEIKEEKKWQVNSQAWVMKVNVNNGKSKWSKIFSRSAGWDASFLAVTETKQKDIILVGSDGYIVRLKPNGEMMWSQTQPGFTVNYTSVEEMKNGEILLVGQQSIGRNYGGGANDYPYLSIISQDGEILKTRVIKSALEGGLQDIVKTKQERYLAVGSAHGQSDVHNAKGFLVELNATASTYQPPLKNITEEDNINYQKQRINLDFDLLNVLDEISPQVELNEWSTYYEREEHALLASAWDEKGVPIILIHGFQAKASTKSDYQKALQLVFEKFVARLVQTPKITANELQIYGCVWPTKINSIEENAQLLKEAIAAEDDLKYRDDIIIVAHSMGGILARSYIEQYGGAEHVQRLITIATPHQGVPPTLAYNWTQSDTLQNLLRLTADNSFGIDFPGLEDTFATDKFYELTNFAPAAEVKKTNSFLKDLNQNFADYYDSGLYKLVAADAAGDDNISFMYDLIANNYAGVKNDGLVATASALFDEKYSGIVKKGSHAAITEDEDVITAIINDIDDLLYHVQLDDNLLEVNQKLKVEIYKKSGEEKFKIYSKVVTGKQWGTDNFEKILTLQGEIETALIGLSGQNLVEIYNLEEQELISSFTINKQQPNN